MASMWNIAQDRAANRGNPKGQLVMLMFRTAHLLRQSTVTFLLFLPYFLPYRLLGLRRRTIEMLLEFCARRRDVMRFFRTTWIPDETFFQTLVRHLVPEHEIRTRTLTFLMFTDYGMPVTFYNDHYDLLLSQDYLFARKISPDAKDLKERLGKLYAAKGVRFVISNEGRSLFKFLTGRGRIGRRFAPRFWETEASLGRERTLMMVTCKKWHVAKRLGDSIIPRARSFRSRMRGGRCSSS